MTDERSTAPSTPHGAPSRRCSRRPRRALLALVVALATAAAWLPSLRNRFVWDDQYDIIRSDRLHHARAIVDVFAHHAMWSADQPETAIATYRPLALATLAVDWHFFRLRPRGYHATNVALHVLAVLALFLALSSLVEDRAAAAIALVFALHPADAEAVAWINGRSEMLALGFGALAIAAAATGRVGAMAVALLLAMLGKETGVVFVPVAVAVALLQRRESRAAATTVVAALVAVGGYFALRRLALGHSVVPTNARAAAAALLPVLAKTTAAAIAPWRRAPIELSTWLASLSATARIGWTLAGAALVLALAALVLRRRWLAAIGLAWWLGALAPTATIAALDYPWPGLGRWLYVGLPGLLLVAAELLRAIPARAQLAVAGAVVAVFVVAAERAIATWHDDGALYEAMIAETPDDAWAWRALGTARLAEDRDAEAAAAFHRAATLDRTEEIHAAYALEAYAWTRLGRCDDAAEQFYAHPETPALPTASFEVALAACRKRLIQETRRVKSAHANGE